MLRPGDDLRQLAEDAVTRGAGRARHGWRRWLAGTRRVRRKQTRHPLVVVPAGTRNHFALDLGLDRDDVPGAGGRTRTVSTLWSTLPKSTDASSSTMRRWGCTRRSCSRRTTATPQVQTAAAMLPDLLGPTATPLDLRYTLPSGEEAAAAQLLLVSNNLYEMAQLRGGGTRERIDGGVLGVVSARVETAADAEKLVALELAGNVRALRELERVDGH